MKISREIKVGIIVTAAIAGLVWGINFLKGSELFSSTNKIYAIYRNIDGLVASNHVILNGYKIGQVQKLRFIPDNSGRIVVTFRVRKDVFISKNSIARIVSSDFLGGKAVEIELGSDSDPASDGDTLHSELNSGIAQQLGPVKDKAENLIQSLDTVATALHSLLDEAGRKNLTRSITHLADVMENLERITSSLDRMTASGSGNISKTFNNLESVSANLKNNNDKITGIMDDLSAVSDSLSNANIAATVNNLNRTAAELNLTLSKINKGTGTLGKIANDDSLYYHLTASLADLDKLLVDFKANPKKYVHFSMFGKSGK